MRVLLIDAFFPCAFAKWRLVEIHSFIMQYHADICVLTCDKNSYNTHSDFNYEDLCEKFKLTDYNILIFNPNFNYINKYNNNEFDGTIFNNKLKGVDYIFKYKYENNENNNHYNIRNYDVYYHIFLSVHQLFNKIVVKNVPLHQQYLHLYPGGGFSENTISSSTMKYLKNNLINTNIIYTQKFIDPYINNKSRKLYSFGCPLFYKDEMIRKKKGLIKNKQLCVAFASMGDPIAKGLLGYLHVVNISKKLNLPIHFITIGNCGNIDIVNKITDCINLEELIEAHKNIEHYSPMSQDKLDDFYYNTVDVYLNLEMYNEKFKNGWPLGAEPALQGCVLLTKDNYNQNEANNYPIDDFFIINEEYTMIVNKLVQLLDNRVFLSKSIQIQKSLYDLVNYDVAMKHIFKFIEDIK
jgi:hypothetical protein